MRPNGPLHIKYRPTCLEELWGNEDIKSSLKQILSRTKDQITSYLFYGPAGCGKTTLAYILKSELKISDMDFMEFNGANTRGIDTVRGVISSSNLSPLMGKAKMFFFDEAHQLTRSGEEALLKILESPPKGVIFVLCTTNPEKLLSTTLRRLSSFQLRLLDLDDLVSLLSWVSKEEGARNFSQRVFRKIAQESGGSPGTALKILDQVVDSETDEAAMIAIDKVYISDKQILDICRLLLSKGSSVGKWKSMSKLIQEIQVEPEEARYAILGYLTKVLLNSQENDYVSQMIELFSGNFYDSKRFGLVNSLYQACKITI